MEPVDLVARGLAAIVGGNGAQRQVLDHTAAGEPFSAMAKLEKVDPFEPSTYSQAASRRRSA